MEDTKLDVSGGPSPHIVDFLFPGSEALMASVEVALSSKHPLNQFRNIAILFRTSNWNDVPPFRLLSIESAVFLVLLLLLLLLVQVVVVVKGR